MLHATFTDVLCCAAEIGRQGNVKILIATAQLVNLEVLQEANNLRKTGEQCGYVDSGWLM